MSNLVYSPLSSPSPHSWVMYEEPNFRGRMYLLERGQYSSHSEWRAQSPNVQSVRRVINYF